MGSSFQRAKVPRHLAGLPRSGTAVQHSGAAQGGEAAAAGRCCLLQEAGCPQLPRPNTTALPATDQQLRLLGSSTTQVLVDDNTITGNEDDTFTGNNTCKEKVKSGLFSQGKNWEQLTTA